MGLDAGMTFLEIGCGIGRDALQLIDILGPGGTYIGTDVTWDSIAWCQKNISAKHPNFTFHHFDAAHELYNPLGKKTSLDFSLPAADRSVDRISAGSVFTHLFEDEVVHYMREIARVLKPDGQAYATFFLYSEATIEAARRTNVTHNNLRFEHAFGDGCFVNDASYPTGAVAFTDAAMQRMMAHAGVRLARPFLKGAWSGLHAAPDDGQEVAILSIQAT
jgi:SAM-dependent methyltransferase